MECGSLLGGVTIMRGIVPSMTCSFVKFEISETFNPAPNIKRRIIRKVQGMNLLKYAIDFFRHSQKPLDK